MHKKFLLGDDNKRGSNLTLLCFKDNVQINNRSLIFNNLIGLSVFLFKKNDYVKNAFMGS